MSKKKSTLDPDRLIARNKRAKHDYSIEETLEAGLCLTGWEVKSLRAGRAQINEGYVVLRNAEVWLIGAHFSPLPSASTHVEPDPTRSRKLLLQRREISRLVGAVERAGYTLIPLDMHWTRGRAKLSVGLAKGKKQHDQRADIKERDWKRDKARMMRHKA